MDDAQDQRDHDDGADSPEPEPGVTAPLDDLTEEEKKSGPMGVMPGAGPEPDEIENSGVEAQEAREERKGQKDQNAHPDRPEDREDQQGEDGR